MAAEQFIRVLRTSLEQAEDIHASLTFCGSLGGLPHQAAIDAYLVDLEIYINANRRISMQCAELYGPGKAEIAQEAITKIIGAN